MSSPSELATAVHLGLSEPDPQDSIRMVKNAVRTGLLMIDGSPAIRDTGYFNHSFAPDFVLQWRGSQESIRAVYLKFADDPDYLAHELRLVADQRPLVVELDLDSNEPRQRDDATVSYLAQTAKSTESLVVDPDALSAFRRGQERAPILRLLGRALLQGGRGLVDEDAADETSKDVALGVEGAQRLDIEPTRRASLTLTEVLGGAAQSRVLRFLQALWIGSGGSESTFPGKVELSGILDDDALAFLLETEGVAESDDFWRRIGSNLTVDQLARLPIQSDHLINLQYLIDANLDRLWARVAKVIDWAGQISLDSNDQLTPWWSVRRGLLALVGPGYEAYIGTLTEQLEGLATQGQEPSLADLLTRAAHNEIRLGELLLSSGKRFMAYGSNNDEDVSRDENLSGLAASLGPEVKVRCAVASLTYGRHLSIHFDRSSANAQGPSRIPLRELVVTAVPLLHTEAVSHGERLKDVMAPERREPTLFDDI